VVNQSGVSVLREETVPYGALFDGKTGTLSALTPLWNSGSLYT